VPPLQLLRLEVRARDYRTAERTLRLDPNGTAAWDVRLERLPGPDTGNTWAIPYLGLEMVWIRPGSFLLGSPLEEAERLPVEGPQVQASLARGFWMGRYEVTQEEFHAIRNSRPSRFAGPNKPVESVSWQEAMAFAKALTEREQKAGRLPPGYEYRLPTEAEWEYACRAGTTGPFSFGSRADARAGNFKGSYPSRSSDYESEIYGTREVGQYPANPWGLFDMHGNVREWCLDSFAARYSGDPVTDRYHHAGDSDRVYRGGGWEDAAGHARSASRDRLDATSRSASIGFRLVLAPEVEAAR
jgi:formylglycine-generating enzyme required for sulfatase activity